MEAKYILAFCIQQKEFDKFDTWKLPQGQFDRHGWLPPEDLRSVLASPVWS